MNTTSAGGLMSPAAASAATVMARSNDVPRLGREAGVRLTVSFRRLNGRPEFWAAERMRSFASLSEESGSPRSTNAGRVWPMSASTSTT